jgi:hypothetical protein
VKGNTPDRSTAAAFPQYLTGEVVASCVVFQWPGLLCPALAASARGGSFSRARYSRAPHLLPSPWHGGIPGTRRWRRWITRQIRVGDLTRQRITRAQQLIRETSRSLIEAGLELGYTSPSHFAQVFRHAPSTL